MSSKINKISIQSLNALFSILEQQPHSALWIRSNDFQRQLYVNENYETIWQRPATLLYQQPESMLETLYPVDRDAIRKQLDHKATHHLEQDNVFFYRIITPSGDVKFIKDWHYLLTDTQNQVVGFAGLAQDIPQAQWQTQLANQQQRKAPDPKAQLQQHVFNILQNELHLKAQQVTGAPTTMQNSQSNSSYRLTGPNQQAVSLTRREQQVLDCLQQGLSAKQTAAQLHVSDRTVEFHLNNVKDKAGCRTKLELLSRLERVTS